MPKLSQTLLFSRLQSGDTKESLWPYRFFL
jgi:hypothetical protein